MCSREAGSSLVELLVVLVLFGAIGLVSTAAMVSAQRAQRRQTDNAQVLIDSKQALTRLTRAVRAANPVLLAEDRRLRIQRVDGGEIVDTTFAVVSEAGVPQLVADESVTVHGTIAPPVRRVILDRLSSASDAIFGYADASGAAIAATGSSPSTYPTREVRVVTFHLRVHRAFGPPLDIRDSVEVRNSG